MSKSGKKPIENAAAIIERFGGIRPMSAKINVAVTTVQGWKKRDVIPAGRKDIILQTAIEHDIDLSTFFDDAPVIEPVVEEKTVSNDESDAPTDDVSSASDAVTVEDEEKAEDVSEAVAPSVSVESIKTDSVKADNIKEEAPEVVLSASKPDEFIEPKPAASNPDYTELAITTEKRAVTKSSLIAAGLVLLIITAIVATLWPDYEEFTERGTRISAIEDDLSDMKQQQSAFKGLVPENWQSQIDELRTQMSGAQSSAEEVYRDAREVSEDLLAGRNVDKHVVQLQEYVAQIANENGLYGLYSRFETMSSSVIGQQKLDGSVESLLQLFNTVEMEDKDEGYVNNVLGQAREQSALLGETFGDVPEHELKAAAMLLGLTQMRSSLNRGDEAFDGDLQLLMNMVDEDDVELRAALEKLAPHAKSGVLTPEGLSKEFRTVAGDVVAASLSGEDISLSERMSARVNDILKIEKDGELISGTDTQVTVDKTQKMVEEGQLDAAVKLLKKNLNSAELRPLKPWLNKVEGVLNAKSAQKAIEQAIELNTGRGFLGGSQLLSE
ncbi:MAG: COG4223 family protein [Alphaproteobacteria bacterium]